MLCEKCNKVEATVHVSEEVAKGQGKMKEYNLCEACFNQSELAKKFSGKTAGWKRQSTKTVFSDDGSFYSSEIYIRKNRKRKG